MPSSAIEATNSAISEFFTHGTIDEDSPTACDKVTLKTVCGMEHTKNSNWSQIAINPMCSICHASRILLRVAL